MRPRRRTAGLLLLTGAIGTAVVVAVGFTSRGGEPAGPTRSTYRGSEPPARFTLPAFSLRSYRGTPVGSGALAGKVVLLTVLDAQCTDVCPVLASVVARSVDRLAPEERRGVRALGVTGDPREDTPAAVRRFLRMRRAVGRIDYLLGTEAELRPLWTALRILPSLDSGRDNVHSAPLRIYDRDSVWVATLHAGADLNEENLLHDIRAALRAGTRAAG